MELHTCRCDNATSSRDPQQVYQNFLGLDHAGRLSTTQAFDHHVQSWLDVPGPVAIAEALRSRYKGRRLPLARSVMEKPFPVFPELLEDLSHLGADRPYSNRSMISAFTLDFKAMEKLGILHLSPWSPPPPQVVAAIFEESQPPL